MRRLKRGRMLAAVGAAVVVTALLLPAGAEAAPPAATDDHLTLAPGTSGSVNVLANDTDSDGQTLTVVDWSVVSPPEVGAECEPTGVCLWTAPANAGTWTFDYEVSDGAGGTDIGHVVIEVRSATTWHRTITLKLSKHLIAAGQLSAPGGPSECVGSQSVQIQLKRGGFKTLKTATTNGSGAYRVKLPDKTGVYRAMVSAEQLTTPPNDTCQQAISHTARN